MSKPKPENEETELRSKSMSQVLESLHGSNVFVKKLHRTHVPRKNCKCHGLALPKCFLEGNMANLCKSIVLLTGKTWSLRLAVTFRSRHSTPKVVFMCGGWKGFAASNNLVEGDQLVFHLTAPSQFHVYIFNADGIPKSEVPELDSECKQEQVEDRKPSVSGYFVKEEVIQEILGEDLEERKPSANGSCGYSVKEEVQDLAEEGRGRNTDENSTNKDRRAPRDQQHEAPHPSFFKRLTLTNFKDNYLEIPAMFTKTYGNRLQSPVKLQGVFEESAVCTVACRWKQTREESQLRLFLGCGWKEFSNGNMLEVEQELEFTLVSDSYFVVRECSVNSP